MIGKPRERIGSAHNAEDSLVRDLSCGATAHDPELYDGIDEMEEETHVRSLRVDIETVLDEIKEFGFRVTAASPSTFLWSQAESRRQQVEKRPSLRVRDINDQVARGFGYAMALGDQLFGIRNPLKEVGNDDHVKCLVFKGQRLAVEDADIASARGDYFVPAGFRKDDCMPCAALLAECGTHHGLSSIKLEAGSARAGSDKIDDFAQHQSERQRLCKQLRFEIRSHWSYNMVLAGCVRKNKEDAIWPRNLTCLSG